MLKYIVSFIIINVIPLSGQDIFDTLQGGTQAGLSFDFSGFLRGAFFAGKNSDVEKIEQKSGYGELGVRLRAKKAESGAGYAEIRLVQGHQLDSAISEFRLREAYVDAYLGDFDLRVGQQIAVWGRADAFNPTNNITPRNILIFSSDEDDRRMGNFLFRLDYHLDPLRIRTVFVPKYRSSILPTSLFPVEDYIEIGDQYNPENTLQNSSYALKVDLVLSSIEGSVSYFHGFMPMPGISLQSIDTEGGLRVVIANKPYKMDVLGLDFSTSFSSLGMRGELAYRRPVEDYTSDYNVHVPNPDLQFVFGLDKSVDDFQFIFQYIGRYVFDFTEYKATGFPTDQLYIYNRMIAYQLNKESHAVFIRPSVSFFHQTLHADLLTYYDIITKESIIRCLVSYDLRDGLIFKIGTENYIGPENTLLGTIDRALSSAFVEMRVSF